MSDAVPPDAGTVTVRYWAAARAAAGRSEDTVPAGALDDVLTEVLALHPGNDRLARVVAMCSVLVGDVAVRAADHAGVDVPSGSLVELLPPFAGG